MHKGHLFVLGTGAGNVAGLSHGGSFKEAPVLAARRRPLRAPRSAAMGEMQGAQARARLESLLRPRHKKRAEAQKRSESVLLSGLGKRRRPAPRGHSAPGGPGCGWRADGDRGRRGYAVRSMRCSSARALPERKWKVTGALHASGPLLRAEPARGPALLAQPPEPSSLPRGGQGSSAGPGAQRPASARTSVCGGRGGRGRGLAAGGARVAPPFPRPRPLAAQGL